MKVATRVVALLAVLASGTAANAATHVWFTAVPTGGGAGVDVNGGPGVTTALNCLVTASPCTWTVTMAFAVDAGDLNVVGYHMNLFTDAVQGKISADNLSLVYDHAAFGAHPFVPVYGSGPMIMGNINGADTANFVGADSGALAHFSLRKVKTLNELQTDTLFAAAGSGEWADTDGNLLDMEVGGNGVVAGGGGAGTVLGAAITIRNFPEPSSLSLLGLGALALIRRRR